MPETVVMTSNNDNNNTKTFQRQHVRPRQAPSSSVPAASRPASLINNSADKSVSRSSRQQQQQQRSSLMTSSRSSASSSACSASSRRPKSVNFAPAVRVHLTVGRWELSATEHTRIWTSSVDTKSSQDGILDTVRQMRRLLSTDGELASDCESTLLARNRTSRGVEHMRTRTSIAARRQVKLDVVDAVLEEQHRQRCQGVDNPVTVAEASMLVSKRCRTKAAVKGGEDAAMARVVNRRGSTETDKSPVVKKTTTSTSASRTSRATISNLSRYSTTTFDVVEEEEASVVAVVDPATLTAVSLNNNANVDGSSAGAPSTREDRSEVDTMFTNISHKRLRDKLLQRVSGLALGA